MKKGDGERDMEARAGRWISGGVSTGRVVSVRKDSGGADCGLSWRIFAETLG